MAYEQQTWALIKDGSIVNTVLCDDNAPTVFGDGGWDQIIDITNCESLTDPGVGATWTEAEGFRRFKPLSTPSYVWDDALGSWVPPVAKPAEVEGKYWTWDEPTLAWIQGDVPEEAAE
tara:strand:+ start:2638 stop:2991 length:354 start_codon:yes stop_codon:yes gene_type:complete